MGEFLVEFDRDDVALVLMAGGGISSASVAASGFDSFAMAGHLFLPAFVGSLSRLIFLDQVLLGIGTGRK